MRFMMIAAAAAALFTTGAQAALVTFTAPTGKPTAVLNPIADDTFGTVFENVTGSIGGLRASPWRDGSTEYSSVSANSTASYLFDERTTFSLYWGSIDTYNDLIFRMNGVVLGTLNGAAVRAETDGRKTSIVNVVLSEAFDEVIFSSDRNAFEYVILTQETPIPGAALLFGGALAGFFAKRRRA